MKLEPPEEASAGAASSDAAMDATEEKPNDSPPGEAAPRAAVVLKPRAKYKSSPMRVDVVESLDKSREDTAAPQSSEPSPVPAADATRIADTIKQVAGTNARQAAIVSFGEQVRKNHMVVTLQKRRRGDVKHSVWALREKFRREMYFLHQRRHVHMKLLGAARAN